MDREDKEKQVEFGISEVGEDATKYGEFISSYFAWVSLPQQKEKVEELQNMTKKDTKNKKKWEKQRINNEFSQRYKLKVREGQKM